MKQIQVLFPKDQIVRFCDEAGKTKGDVNALRGRLIVDAKSLLGLAALGALDPIVVEYPEDAVELEAFLLNFKV